MGFDGSLRFILANESCAVIATRSDNTLVRSAVFIWERRPFKARYSFCPPTNLSFRISDINTTIFNYSLEQNDLDWREGRLSFSLPKASSLSFPIETPHKISTGRNRSSFAAADLSGNLEPRYPEASPPALKGATSHHRICRLRPARVQP